MQFLYLSAGKTYPDTKSQFKHLNFSYKTNLSIHFQYKKNNANHATLFSLLHLIPTRKKQKYSQTFSFDSTSFEEAYLHYYNFLPTNALRIRNKLIIICAKLILTIHPSPRKNQSKISSPTFSSKKAGVTFYQKNSAENSFFLEIRVSVPFWNNECSFFSLTSENKNVLSTILKNPVAVCFLLSGLKL